MIGKSQVIRIKILVIKILKRLKLLSHLNFFTSICFNNASVKIPFINGMGINIFLSESNWLDTLIESFCSNDDYAFIDVGVNVGQTLLKVKTIRPDIKYLGFEPNSSCISYVQQLIKINRFQNCIIHNCALSSEITFKILQKNLIDDVRASLVPELRPDYFVDGETITSINYDSFYSDQNICFVKIDVEGSELEVIKGMVNSINKHQPIIICEVLDSHLPETFNFTKDRAAKLSQLLTELDYSIIQLM